MDIRYEKLAETLVYHSTKLNPDEGSIHSIDIPQDMTLALIRAKAMQSHSLCSASKWTH